MIAAIVMLWRAFPARGKAADGAYPVTRHRHLLRIGLSLFSAEAVNLAISGAPPFVLGALSTTSAVALYAIAWRVVLVVYMFISTVGSLVAPRFARHFALGEMAELRAEARRGIGLALGLGLLPIGLVAFASSRLLGLFGPHFLPALWTLRILLIGQCAATLSATTPELLGMTGYDRSLLRINGVALVVLMAALVIAAPMMGAEGAALATTITLIVTALATSWVARRKLGFTPLGALLAARA
jgi:O-antigen/teichoic acid export membrane protein